MNVKKFIAANSRDALRKVKETLGNEAIILSNRGVPGGVEIMAVAQRDMAMIVPTSSPAPAPAQQVAQVADQGEDYRVLLSSARARVAQQTPTPFSKANGPAQPAARPAAMSPTPSRPAVNAGIPRTGALRQPEMIRPASAPAQPAPEPRPKPFAQPASLPRTEAEVVPQAVMEEIRSLRKIVEQHLAGFAWGESVRAEPVKTEVLRQMLDAGFSPQLARDLLTDFPPEMDAVQGMAWVKGVADRSLLTVGIENDIVDRGGVYALVG
ncbi:MAG: flagellar biosynthesis protein FlhF, partial [Azonexus sp.]|nr:flagellar biosynthesis protein FlhF [Azonexus sp.]